MKDDCITIETNEIKDKECLLIIKTANMLARQYMHGIISKDKYYERYMCLSYATEYISTSTNKNKLASSLSWALLEQYENNVYIKERCGK